MATRSALRLLHHTLRWYLRYVPLRHGKLWLWNLINRYILWRDWKVDMGIARTVFGATVRCQLPDLIQSYIFYFGLWEPAITKLITTRLPSNGVFIDIGANVGYHSLLASTLVGNSGKVYAIEASPTIFGMLLSNVKDNGYENISALNYAVTSAPCDVQIYLAPGANIGGTTLVPAIAQQRNARLEATVSGLTLDKLIPPEVIVRASMIKIDVEGAEWSVLQGMRHLIADLSPETELLVEINRAAIEAAGGTVAALMDMFTSCGFRPYLVNSHYKPSEYTFRDIPVLEPLKDLTFEQADVLFSRRGAEQPNKAVQFTPAVQMRAPVLN